MTDDFRALRDLMVDTQLIPRGIRDQRVLSAMRKIPRHLFVSENVRQNAYADMALPIKEDQTISQPYMVAVMTELLNLKGAERVLEIGTGSGYQAAVLGELAAEVYTVERIQLLADEARKRMADLGYANVHVSLSDGTLGCLEHSPYDRIIVTAAAPRIPMPLVEQLEEGGLIVVPVGERFSQVLIRGKKQGGILIEEYGTPCVFVPLIGEYGWAD